MAAATAVLALTLVSVIVLVAAYAGAVDRGASRALRDAGAYPGDEVAALVDVQSVPDTTGFLRIAAFLPPPRASAFVGPPPPGTTAWPQPGHTWLSPALADGHEVGDSTPWGRLAGTISGEGLAAPGERLAYTHPALARPSEQYWPITGFGMADGSLAVPLGMVATNRPLEQPLTAMIAFVVLPAAVLVTVAVRAASTYRSGRASLLRALGSTTSLRTAVALGEILRPILLGCAAALALVVVCSFVPALPLPGTGVGVWGRDLRGALPASVGVVLGASAAVLAIGCVTVPAADGTVRLRAAAGRPRRLLPIAAVASTLAFYQVAAMHLGAYAFLAAMLTMVVVSLLALPTAVSLALRWTGGAVARCLPRSGALLVATRQAAANPRLLERSASGVLVAVALVGVVHLYLSQLSEPAAQARLLSQQLDQSVVVAELSGQPTTAAGDLLKLVGPQVAVFAVSGTSGSTTVSSTCTDLVLLREVCPSPGKITRLTGNDVRIGLVAPWAFGSQGPPLVSIVDALPREGVGALVMVDAAREPLPVEALTRVGYQSGVAVTEPGASWSMGTALSDHQNRWLVLWGTVSVVVLAGAVIVATRSDIADRYRSAAPVFLLAGREQVAWVVTAWNQLLPMLLGAAAGIAFYYAASVPLVNHMHARTSGALVVVLAGAGLAAGLVGWGATASALIRTARRSRRDLRL